MANYKSLVKALLKEPKITKKKVEQLKTKWAKKYKVKLPLSSEILAYRMKWSTPSNAPAASACAISILDWRSLPS